MLRLMQEVKMKKEKTIRAEVYKYDPDVDKAPYFMTYDVPSTEKMSVTNVLEYIYENLDHSLAFFVSCKRGNCSRCVVAIEGKNCLACTTEVKGDVRIEPAKDRKVIRDLRVEGI
jgi:succinate dehydrogenase/fumarate reductase-like Fe-S protein